MNVIVILLAPCLFDSFQNPQNRFPRRPNIQPHKPAAFLAELHTGIQADTGLVDEKVFQLGVTQIHGAAVEPEQVGAFGWDGFDFR